MPELPEVEVVARGLARCLDGARVRQVDLRRSDIVRGGHQPLFNLPLSGRSIDQIRRSGKLVRFDISGQLTLHVHLGMTGRLVLTNPSSPLESHTHLIIRFEQKDIELRYCDPRRFGGIWIANGSPAEKWTGRRIPPITHDPLRMTIRQWHECLKPRRQIKALLMSQDPISGIGNIYCDEALHRAGVHPLTRACDISTDKSRALYRAVRLVLNEAIRAGGSSISDYRNAEGDPGTYHLKHRVYGRGGKPCRRCRTPIERIVIASRGTHFCPKCQPL